MGQPHPVISDDVGLYSDARYWSFLGHALLATGFIMLDLFWLRQLIGCWKAGTWTRAVAAGALGISLALTAIFPVWLLTRGFKAISPRFVEVFEIAPVNRWILGLVLVVLFVTAAARRMIPAAKMPECDARWNWRRRPSAYYHERRFVALFVAATILCLAARLPMEFLRNLPFGSLPRGSGNLPWWFPFTAIEYFKEVLEWYLTDPRCQLWSVVFCLALYRTIFAVARTSGGSSAAPLELPLSLFAIVWTVLLATVLMAAPIITALGVGLCLNWWRLPF
jgi:hypothetical protein